ncbi:hypothetical protein ElyMa_001858100 [Elysia marginata]|uniref:BZIP domain-containing protein n=1 Tax=Elysia marginata TaxID=1093978 RepID=A0AAV4ELQ5_9GAST|nr:hypothetical protein ElyMa_001858100 [Elysia marginata]
MDPASTPAVSTKSPSPKKLRKNCKSCPIQSKCSENLAKQLRLARSEKRRTVAEIKRDYKKKVINQRFKRDAKRREDLISELASVEKTCDTNFSKLKGKDNKVRQLKQGVCP